VGGAQDNQIKKQYKERLKGSETARLELVVPKKPKGEKAKRRIRDTLGGGKEGGG